MERMCELSGVSRAGFYRQWLASGPRQADTALRDAVQQVAVEKRFYGYRRVQRELRPCGHWVNAKRVLRLMREDNLLCLRTRRFVPATTDSRHGWRVWPNLARGLITRNLNELWVADSQQAPCPADENRSREDSRIAQHSLPEVREDNYASRDTARDFDHVGCPECGERFEPRGHRWSVE